jgi:hypothetical protein
MDEIVKCDLVVLCDHKSEWIHEYDFESILGDVYWCGDCDEMMSAG